MLLRPSLSNLTAAAALFAGLLPAGCGDDQLGAEKRHPARPPETVLSSGPPDSTYATDYRVHLFWSGSDADGTIDHYDYILVDHGAAQDSIATADSSAAHRVVVRVPAPSDPRWRATVAHDTLIVTRADMLRQDPAPPPGNGNVGRHNEAIRRLLLERWHTFFVRAVDNEGIADPTPDYRSFNARNLAPTVFLLPPIDAASTDFHGPQTIVFRWDGSDPRGDGTVQPPVATRWVLLPSLKNAVGEYRGLPDALYRLPESAWSPWRPWEATDGSGRRAVARNLRSVTEEPGVGFYIFAVQAMDEAGGVTPVFDWSTPGKNNAAALFVSNDLGPTLEVQDPFLGVYNFTRAAPPLTMDIVAEQPLRLRWRADASSYGGEIVGYRFGWDVQDLEDDEAWERNWNETSMSAPARVFASGVHRFTLQARDDAGGLVSAVFEFTVRTLVRRRTLLLVDDTVYPRADLERAEDLRWLAVLDSVAHTGGFAFDHSRDVYDVSGGPYRRLAPPLSLVFDYKCVVWAVVPGSFGSGLQDVAMFFDPFLEANRTRLNRYNFMNSFVDNGGKLWVCGNRPATVLWPLNASTLPPDQRLPANVVHWGQEVHPDVDSVGVGSLLYRMGVEAFDVGSGGSAGAGREVSPQHGCVRLRRAMSRGAETRRFTSSRAREHVHFLDIPAADVETNSGLDAEYTTTVTEAHTHKILLTPADCRALREGQQILRPTLADASQHQHTVALADPFALWGAPPALAPEEGVWALPADPQLNPWRSRPNIEIFNMPLWISSRTPPLEPDPALVATPYVYQSGLLEGSSPVAYYPLTADAQPALVLRRVSSNSPGFGRAFCGFEPWLLRAESHLRLAEYLLLRELQITQP